MEGDRKEGTRIMCAFYFLLVGKFKKKNLVEIGIAFSLFLFGSPSTILQWTKIQVVIVGDESHNF